MTAGFRFPDRRFSAAKANEASKLPGHLARLAARVKDETLPDFGAAPKQHAAVNARKDDPEIKRGRR